MQTIHQQLITECWPVTSNQSIAVATLNRPDSLNALSLPIIDELIQCIKAWQDDPAIICILLQSALPRAFCAGGDIRALYKCLQVDTVQALKHAEQYFVQEYMLDYLIHCCPKPIVVWGQGIVMGGGIGLLFGASHRIVTEDSLLAMPEISIGLFPDVGVAGHLASMENGMGMYLALTGNRFNGADAVTLGFADYLLDAADREKIHTLLKNIRWSADVETNHRLLSDGLQSYSKCGESIISQSYDVVGEIVCSVSGHGFNACSEIVTAIQGHINHEKKWLQSGGKYLTQGSALSACLIYRHLQNCQGLQRLQVLMADLNLVMNILRYKKEIMEGIRALLIDKDKAPQWSYADISSVPDTVVNNHFSSVWQAKDNPLVQCIK